MPIDNVVPIDAEAARLLARRDRRFRWFVAGLGAAWLAVLIPIVALTPLPPLVPLLVLGALVVFAEHRFVLFGDETSMSASIVVIVASVFVFADSSPLAGPMLVGSLGGLYLPHLRQRHFGLVSANTAALGLAALFAACATRSLGWNHPTSAWRDLAVASVCLAVYWCADSTLIGLASGLRNGTALHGAIATQVASEWLTIILSLGACLLAQSKIGLGPASATLFVALPLLAFETHIRCAERGSPPPVLMSLGIPLLIGLSCTIASASGGRLGAAVFASGLFLVLSLCGSEIRRRMLSFAAACITGASVLLLNELGAPIAVQFAIAAAISAALLRIAMIASQASALGLCLDPLSVLGALIPNRREAFLLMLIAPLTQLAFEEPSIVPMFAFVALTACAICTSSAPVGCGEQDSNRRPATRRETSASASR